MVYIIGAIVSAILYRLGGMKGMNTKFRDFGVPLVFLAVVYFSGHWQKSYFVSSVLLCCTFLFLELTTYWDVIFKKDNFYAHGLGCGLAMLPLAVGGWVAWFSVFEYAVILSIFMGVLNWAVNKYQVPFRDWIEEFGRGAVIILALPVLFI